MLKCLRIIYGRYISLKLLMKKVNYLLTNLNNANFYFSLFFYNQLGNYMKYYGFDFIKHL